MIMTYRPFIVPMSSLQSLFIEGFHPRTQCAGEFILLPFGLLLTLRIFFLFFAGPILLGLFYGGISPMAQDS